MMRRTLTRIRFLVGRHALRFPLVPGCHNLLRCARGSQIVRKAIGRAGQCRDRSLPIADPVRVDLTDLVRDEKLATGVQHRGSPSETYAEPRPRVAMLLDRPQVSPLTGSNRASDISAWLRAVFIAR